jgi:exodeoxyribonuclease VII small subunit
MAKKKQSNNFEKDLARLEEISSLLDNENIGLEESIALYEEGIKLSKTCLTTLKKAELKITELKKDMSEISSDDNDD